MMGFWAGVVNYPAISKLALLGDSNTANTSGLSFGIENYFAPGYGSYLCRALGQKAELVINPETGDSDFGLNGATAAWFLGANATAVDYLDALLASDADTVVVMLGTNDMAAGSGNLSGADCAANIIELWDIIIAGGKNIAAVACFPQHSGNADAAQFKSRKAACDAILRPAAAARGSRVQWITVDSSLDDDDDGYMDSIYISDTSAPKVHTNITGACKAGLAMGEALLPRVSGNGMVHPIPASGSALWKTPNPYLTGTPGAGNTATSLNLTAVVTASKQLIARTDGVTGNWQEITINGDSNFDPPNLNSGYFNNVYFDVASFVAGATLVATAEFEIVSGTIYHAQLVIFYNGSNRTADAFHNGALGNVLMSPLPLGRYPLQTIPWVSTGTTSTLRVALQTWGDGVIRLGRFGAFEV